MQTHPGAIGSKIEHLATAVELVQVRVSRAGGHEIRRAGLRRDDVVVNQRQQAVHLGIADVAQRRASARLFACRNATSV